MAGEWKCIRVDEIAQRTATGPFGSAISSKYFCDTGVPVIRGSNLSQDIGTRLVDEGLTFVSEEKAEEFARSEARTGDLVFTCWGTIDQVGLIDHRARYKRYIVSNKQMLLTPDPSRADSLFLYYAFSSPENRAAILNRGIGSSVPGFNLGQLRMFEIVLPPLAEQKAIASVLGALDDKIELNRRMNATLEAMARALFQSWFVDFDPVRAKLDGRKPEGLDKATAALFPGAFQDSILGPIPQGWMASRIPDAVEVNPRRTLKSGVVAPYLDMKNLPTQGHSADEVVDREFTSGTKFQNGDTLLARITPCLENGKTGFVDFLDEGQVGWGSTEYIVLAPKPPLPSQFGYLLARSDALRVHAIQNMTGTSGRQRVPSECFNTFYLAVPPLEIARRFDELTTPLMSKIKSNAQESRTLATLRDTLLPKLLSGELRVRN